MLICAKYEDNNTKDTIKYIDDIKLKYDHVTLYDFNSKIKLKYDHVTLYDFTKHNKYSLENNKSEKNKGKSIKYQNTFIIFNQ